MVAIPSSATIFRTTRNAAGLGFLRHTRDPVTRLENDACRYVHDLAFPYCYPGGADPIPAPGNPSNGALVYDASYLAANGSVVKGAGTITYAGGGFDFTGIAAAGHYVRGSASFCNDINTSFGGKVQRYLMFGYFKFPSAANWHSGGTVSFLTYTTGFYSSVPDLVFGEMLDFVGAKRIQFRRQTANNVVSSVNIDLTSSYHDTLVALAYWRNDTEVRLGLYHDTFGWLLSSAGAVGSNNANSLANLYPIIGSSPIGSIWGNAMKFKHYRWVEINLARAGIALDPKLIVEADFRRVRKRITDSAALNSGTSQIFV